MRRVLVTGSRSWKNKSAVCDALDAQWLLANGQMIVVHGACPTGADAHAMQWCRSMERAVALDNGDSQCDCAAHWVIVEERHPADWAAHGKAAGPIRNQQMVEAGADICLAFPLPGSKGTKDCMERARKAGIEVIE